MFTLSAELMYTPSRSGGWRCLQFSSLHLFVWVGYMQRTLGIVVLTTRCLLTDHASSDVESISAVDLGSIPQTYFSPPICVDSISLGASLVLAVAATPARRCKAYECLADLPRGYPRECILLSLSLSPQALSKPVGPLGLYCDR